MFELEERMSQVSDQCNATSQAIDEGHSHDARSISSADKSATIDGSIIPTSAMRNVGCPVWVDSGQPHRAEVGHLRSIDLLTQTFDIVAIEAAG
jgi:hypothetical protein